jgi:hypothetical protein
MTNADILLSKPFTPRQVTTGTNGLFQRDGTFDTLPHDDPFTQAGLRYAAPPVEWETQRADGISIFSPTSSFTFAVAQSGNNIATVFPQAALIASQMLTAPAALVAVSLSYAVRNVTNTGAIALFVTIGNAVPVIGVGGQSDILVGAITPPGAAEQTWSDVRSNSFSLDVAPLIQANQSVGLYCSCANQATDLVWGVVTFKYVTL